MKFVRLYHYFIILASILVVASFLRFYNYSERFGLAYDQAQYALVAKYALETHQLPLLGPFSSAGPFQTSGTWYWIVMIGFAIPISFLGPWILMGIFSLIFILVMNWIGLLFNSLTLSFILAILATVSPAQISQSLNLANQTPISLISAFAIVNAIYYIRRKSILYILLLGFSIGLASSIHLQGLALLPLGLFTMIFSKKYSVSHTLIFLIGLTIPWIPVLIVDIQNEFKNTRQMLSYYLLNPNPVSYDLLGRRWTTFLIETIPMIWSKAIGGFISLIYFLYAILIVTVIFLTKKRFFSIELILLVISFIGMVIIVRYTRTPLFDSYFVFLHPFLLLFTALIINILIKYKKTVVFGVLFFGLFVAGSLFRDLEDIKNSSNQTFAQVKDWTTYLIHKYPHGKFALYDFNYRSTDKSLPLALYLYSIDKLDDTGIKFGLVNEGDAINIRHNYETIINYKSQNSIFDFSRISHEDLVIAQWIFVNPSQIYNATEKWYLTK